MTRIPVLLVCATGLGVLAWIINGRMETVSEIGEPQANIVRRDKLIDRPAHETPKLDKEEPKAQTVRTLWAMLQDPDEQKRIVAAKAVAESNIDAQGLVPELLAMLQWEKVPAVRIAAINALTMVTYRSGTDWRDRKVIAALIRVLRNDNDTAVRWAACESFVMVGRSASAAAPALLDAMKDKDDPRMRELACRSFTYVVGPSSTNLVPDLLEMYQEGIEDVLTERTVLGALGKIGANEDVVIPLLIDVLKNPNPRHVRSRETAAWALGRFGPKAKAAVPHLLTILEESLRLERRDPRDMRQSAVRALGSIGPSAKDAVPLLMHIVDDPSSSKTFRMDAEKALMAIHLEL